MKELDVIKKLLVKLNHEKSDTISNKQKMFEHEYRKIDFYIGIM